MITISNLCFQRRHMQHSQQVCLWKAPRCIRRAGIWHLNSWDDSHMLDCTESTDTMWGCLTLSTSHCFRFLWTFSAPPWILPDLIFRGYWLIEICHSALFFSKQRVIWCLWNITETRTNHVSPLMTLMSSDSSDEASRLMLDQSIGLQQLMNMTEFGSCGYVSHSIHTAW